MFDITNEHDKQKIAFAKIKDRSLCNEIFDMRCYQRFHLFENQSTARSWSEIIRAPNDLVLSKMKDENGKLALHHACQREAPEHVIDLLLANNMSAAGTKSDHNQYPLHFALCWNQTETVVLKILRAFPEAAKAQDQITLDYALHMACAADSDTAYGEALIRELIEAFPEAVTYMTPWGLYPLHFACYRFLDPTRNRSNNASMFKVVHELIKVFPNAVTHMDDNGVYPFMYIRDEVVPEYLVETLLENMTNVAIETQLDSRNNPLTSAIQYHQLVPVVLKFIELFPDAVQQKTDNDEYPLHIACKGNSAPLSIIKALVSHYPDALLEKCIGVDDNGQKYLPLELAVLTGKNQDIIEFLGDATTTQEQKHRKDNRRNYKKKKI